MDKVRFLNIGVGSMGAYHIRQMRKLPEVEIVGLVDPSERSIQAVRNEFPELRDVPAFSDHRAALRDVQADATVIVSPHNQHLEHGLDCLGAGLHVLMEKPFVNGTDNAKRLIAYAQEQGKHLAVSYQRHLQGPYVYLRDLIQSGVLGTINYISVYQAQAWLKATSGSWRQDPEMACGGQLNDSGSHMVDVVLWMTGLEPEEVSAFIDNRGARVDIDSAVSVRFRGGAIASLNIVGSASINWWEDISVHGDKGTALYRNGKLLVAREGERLPTEVPAEALPADSNPDRDFVDLLLGRVSEPAAPPIWGLQVARLTEAAWKSAELGRPVKL